MTHWFLVGLQLGALVAQVWLFLKARRPYEHWQGRQDSGSLAGALSVGTPRERAGGTDAPEAPGASLSPEPVAQEILGWRGWHPSVEPDGFGGWTIRLIGNYGRVWEGPTHVADQRPEPTNENGIYARPLDWVQRQLSWPSPLSFMGVTGPSPIQGLVALTGRVLEGERGWQAERGTIRELWVLPGSLSVPALLVLDQLEQRYKCEIHYETPPETVFRGWMYA